MKESGFTCKTLRNLLGSKTSPVRI